MSSQPAVSSKAQIVQRLYRMGGVPPEELGPGSKEKKSALLAAGRAVGLDLAWCSGKIECGRVIADRIGIEWGPECYSTGDTVTVAGLSRLADGVERFIGGSEQDPSNSRVESRNVSSDREVGQNVSDITEIEQNICEGIASLSRFGPTPTEVEAPRETLALGDVSFASGSWRAGLAAVQGWLRLSNTLNVESVNAFSDTLATGLGELAGIPETELLPRLAERLERALELRQQFEDMLESEAEGGATRESATQAWVAAWSEVEDEDESEGSGPIRAEASTWTITDFVGYAEDGELVLSPSYQRADVWPTATAQQLIESILRGIPLPSVILLQRQEGTHVSHEVVDGKQRLTSILRFVGRHPRALELVERKQSEWGANGLADLFQSDYPGFKRLWREKEMESLTAAKEKEYYFPFPLRSGDVRPLKGMEHLKGKYYCQIQDATIEVVGEPRRVYTLFERSNSKYKVPVIVYESVTSEQIHEVFSLYNKQGKHLNAEEIRNALYHHLDFMRGLLVTAGDSDDVATVAPFLTGEWDDLASTPEILDDYGFGRAGYKRTKLLSWVAAALFYDDGGLPSRSTAAHTNVLLKRIDDDPRDPLRDARRVTDVMVLLDRALDAHALVPSDVWSPVFRNAQGKSKWQELQLVATLVAFGSAFVVLGDELDDRLQSALGDLGRESGKWMRPEKTQTREQWRYIGRVVDEILGVLGVGVAEADEEIVRRFGSSGLIGLASATRADVSI